jgi:hypothetical protein
VIYVDKDHTECEGVACITTMHLDRLERREQCNHGRYLCCQFSFVPDLNYVSDNSLTLFCALLKLLCAFCASISKLLDCSQL